MKITKWTSGKEKGYIGEDMKLKVQKRKNDIILEYFHMKDVNSLRYNILKYVIDSFNEKILLYVDTNNKIEIMFSDNIKKVLEDNGVVFKYEPVESAKRGVLGFRPFFRNDKKNKMNEAMFLAEINKDTPLKNLYYGFLKDYDYAVCINPEKDIGELILRFKMDAYDVLFNKEYFQNTLYDSIVAGRMRMDAPYDLLLKYYEEYDQKT